MSHLSKQMSRIAKQLKYDQSLLINKRKRNLVAVSVTYDGASWSTKALCEPCIEAFTKKYFGADEDLRRLPGEVGARNCDFCGVKNEK